MHRLIAPGKEALELTKDVSTTARWIRLDQGKYLLPLLSKWIFARVPPVVYGHDIPGFLALIIK
ncbi:hypothetical protein [Dictyobacter aurantiacus]|uniref:Uncharacterized protein n=1 Tax=Dictyobacter aurantiacus TaxID=1936993 RepID=A0A401Z9L7_9CHLR|nr:hypothetical protein [Dictyobacter aurantiacus]GCE03532.1 hypothetical protein KDAU_08610 [Dictyobacter aurantiacus]